MESVSHLNRRQLALKGEWHDDRFCHLMNLWQNCFHYRNHRNKLAKPPVHPRLCLYLQMQTYKRLFVGVVTIPKSKSHQKQEKQPKSLEYKVWDLSLYDFKGFCDFFCFKTHLDFWVDVEADELSEGWKLDRPKGRPGSSILQIAANMFTQT